MHTPIDIDQQAIDEKIQHFMASRSSLKTLSKSIAERLAPSVRGDITLRDEISYEPLNWTALKPRRS